MFFNIKHEIKGYRRRKSGRVLPDYTPIISIYDRGLIYRIYKDCDGDWSAICKAGSLSVGCVSQTETRFKNIFDQTTDEWTTYKPLTLSEVIKLVQSKVESGIYEDLRRFLKKYEIVGD